MQLIFDSIIKHLMEILTFIMIITTWFNMKAQSDREIIIDAINTIDKVLITSCFNTNGGNFTISFDKHLLIKDLDDKAIENIKNNRMILCKPEKVRNKIYEILDDIKKVKEGNL